MNKLLFLFSLFISSTLLAQTSTMETGSVAATAIKLPIDKSPMDMAYYPANYPILKIRDKAAEPLVARVIYSRPQKESRTIFGGLVEYGKVWRLGANEATEIEVFRDVKVKDKKLPKGRYSIFAIPTEKNWTIIFNKDTDVWGAFKYNEKQDVLRVDVPVENLKDTAEAFSINFSKMGGGAQMMFAWDTVMVNLPIYFSTKP